MLEQVDALLTPSKPLAKIGVVALAVKTFVEIVLPTPAAKFTVPEIAAVHALSLYSVTAAGSDRLKVTAGDLDVAGGTGDTDV